MNDFLKSSNSFYSVNEHTNPDHRIKAKILNFAIDSYSILAPSAVPQGFMDSRKAADLLTKALPPRRKRVPYGPHQGKIHFYSDKSLFPLPSLKPVAAPEGWQGGGGQLPPLSFFLFFLLVSWAVSHGHGDTTPTPLWKFMLNFFFKSV